jgi:hypothetical protein
MQLNDENMNVLFEFINNEEKYVDFIFILSPGLFS